MLLSCPLNKIVPFFSSVRVAAKLVMVFINNKAGKLGTLG